MEPDKLKLDVITAVAEYVADTEAWDEAELSIDTTTGRVALIESDEEDSLAETVDVYDIMEFVDMTPEGKWQPDVEAIDLLVADYKS